MTIKRHDRLIRFVRAASISSLFVYISGCGYAIPAAIWVEPRDGSERRIEFVDSAGRLSLVNGAMIVSWNEEWYFWFGQPNGSPSNHIIAVRGGACRLPNDWRIRILFISSAEFPRGLFWMALFSKYDWYKAPLILPGAVLPWPSIQPYEGLSLYPLIPGYFPAQAEKITGRYNQFAVPTLRSEEWRLRIRSNSEDPKIAKEYWQDALYRLRLKNEPRKDPANGADLRFRPKQYHQVRAFIEEELAIIERLIPPPSTMPNISEGEREPRLESP